MGYVQDRTVNYSCQPWINAPLGCLIGGVPFKYQIMTIDYWGSTPLVNKLWFINPGLTLEGITYLISHVPSYILEISFQMSIYSFSFRPVFLLACILFFFIVVIEIGINQLFYTIVLLQWSHVYIIYIYNIPHDPFMVYLLTFGWFCSGTCWCAYSSTMVRIWDKYKYWVQKFMFNRPSDNRFWSRDSQ